MDEYAGLSLGVKEDETLRILVDPPCDQASIKIVDNDSKFMYPLSSSTKLESVANNVTTIILFYRG